MIARDDAVIALSNSGDTAELCDIVAYAKRFRIPLIGITRRTHSSLAEQSDVALVLPPSPEACPLGLAPTTSTTLMLALSPPPISRSSIPAASSDGSFCALPR